MIVNLMMESLQAYPETFPVTTVPMFADVTAYMLTTSASLQDLKSRLPGHISPEVDQRTFRPNIVVSGASLRPWEEDTWVGEVRIGEAVLTYNKDCTRCVGTKINPNTGSLYEDDEPLTTLKKFRQHDKYTFTFFSFHNFLFFLVRSHQIIRRAVGDSPVFGMHYGVIKKGKWRSC